MLILDEPTDGLDPNQKHEMRGIIRAMSPEKAIIISTHLLDEVEAVCSRAIIIARGRILADDTPAELAARSRYHNAVRVGDAGRRRPDDRGRAGASAGRPLGRAGERRRRRGAGGCSRAAARDPAEIGELVRARGWPVSARAERGRLDDVFRAITCRVRTPRRCAMRLTDARRC